VISRFGAASTKGIAAGIFSDFGGTATTDIAGLISRFGAPFATDIRRLPKLIDETEDGEAVVEVLAALTALVWCATLIGVWPQWAAGDDLLHGAPLLTGVIEAFSELGQLVSHSLTGLGEDRPERARCGLG
jgi:hypothetical protein